MQQEVNKAYAPLFTEHPRYFILMGGRGAGRSTVASQFAASKLAAPEYFRAAIMRYILHDIRNSIYQEIIDRIDETGTREAIDINTSVMSFKYGVNTINAQGFKKSSGEQKSKLKSLANYNCILVEEADEIAEADFMQLDDSLRTVKGDITIILLLNPPPREHWIIKRWFDLQDSGIKDFYIPSLKSEAYADTIAIRTSYLDNIANLSPQTIHNYESYQKTNPDYYYNMIKGLVPEVARGKIYSGWRQIDDLPFEARLERYGLDYGYSNDPTAIVAVYSYDGGYVLDEVTYQTELSNKDIADVLKLQKKALVIPDSSEPKSNAELRLLGIHLLPAEKGADSVVHGIQKIKTLKISVTKRSHNIWTEYNNYVWIEDKEGRKINEPKDAYNHAMDAMRYALETLLPKEPKKETEQKPYETSMPYSEVVNQVNTEDAKPMRRPPGWGNNRGFQQPDYQSAQSIDGM